MKINKDDINLIAIDFDGTFLDDSHYKQDLSYVDKIRKLNLKQEIVFASGRATAGIVELVKRLNLLDLVRYVIGHNGAEIYDIKENKIIYQNVLDEEIANKIIKIIYNREDKLPIAFHDWDKFYSYNYHELLDMECKVNFVNLVLVDDISKFPNKKLKLMIFTPNKNVDEIYDLIEKSEVGNKVTQARSGDMLNEITTKGINKAKGLEILCERLNISLNNVLSFGNAENDIEMLKKSRYGFAMKNSGEDVLNSTNFVTEFDNNNFGVEKEILKIFK